MKLVAVEFTGLPSGRDVVLNLEEPPHGGLHVLYGPNEAGKSTLLRALLDVWFNAESARAGYTSSTRLATVLERNGVRKQVIRRLYRKQLALRDGDIVSEEELRQWLGGLDAEMYRLWWGFDHERLRSGSQALLEAQGEAGASLLAAGGGVQHLRQVLTQVERRMTDLFAPSSGTAKKPLNQAIRRLQEADQALRQSALRPDAWTRVQRELEDTESQLQELLRERNDVDTALRRLQRIWHAAPLVRRHEALEEEILALADAPDWSAERAAAVLTALAEADQVRAEQRRWAGEIEKLQAALAATVPDPQVLAVEAEIEQLAEGLDEYVRLTEREIPDRQSELKAGRTDLERRLGAIQPGASLDDAQSLLPPMALIEAARHLAEQKTAKVQTWEHERQRLAETEEEIRAYRAQLRSGQTAPASIEGLRAALTAAHTVSHLDDALAELSEREAAVLRQMDARVVAQRVWAGSSEALLRLPIPLEATVERFQAVFAQLHEQRWQREQQRQSWLEESEGLERELRALEQQGPLPSEAQLQAERRARDTLWRAIRARWLGHTMASWATGASETAAAPDPAVAQTAVSGEDVVTVPADPWQLADDYEVAVKTADDTADALQRESNRVQAWRQKRGRWEEVKRRIEALDAELRALSDQEADIQAQWRAAWAQAGIEPLPPEEMRAWLQTVYKPLLRDRDVLEDLRSQRNAALQRWADASADLVRALNQAGAPTEAVEGARVQLRTLIAYAEDWLQACERQMSKAISIAEALEKAEARLREAERRVRDAEAAIAALDAQWAQVRGDAQHLPEEVRAAIRVLDHLEELRATIARWREDEVRLQETLDRARRYQARVASLAARLGEQAPESGEVAARVRAWRQKLTLAHTLYAQRKELQKRWGEVQASLQELDARWAALSAQLRAAGEEAGCDTEQALRRAAERARERAGRIDARDDVRRQLAELAAGGQWAHVLREVREGPAADVLEADIRRYEQRREQLDAQLQTLQQRKGQLLEQRCHMETHTLDAITGAQEAESAFADADDAWRQWLRLLLANRLLHRVLDEFRDRTEAHVLTAAGEALATLTHSRYTGVELEWTGDTAYLVAVGPDGAQRPETLSDGTRDQLFLALRLAYLRRHLEDGEPLPVVMDDVFVHFDDARTEAALTALADLARHTQVLYLTHHRAVAVVADRLAARGLPVRLHTLQGP